MMTEFRYSSAKYKVLWKSASYWIGFETMDRLCQGVVVQCVQYRVSFLGCRRIRRQNILSDRSLKDLADTIPELYRGHARFDVPHRMVHVDKDSAETILV